MADNYYDEQNQMYDNQYYPDNALTVTNPNQLQNQVGEEFTRDPLYVNYFEKYNYTTNYLPPYQYKTPKNTPARIVGRLDEVQGFQYSLEKKPKTIQPVNIYNLNILNQRRFRSKDEIIASRKYHGQLLNPESLLHAQMPFPTNKPVVSENYEFKVNFRKVYFQDYEINREDMSQTLLKPTLNQELVKVHSEKPDVLLSLTSWEEDALAETLQ